MRVSGVGGDVWELKGNFSFLSFLFGEGNGCSCVCVCYVCFKVAEVNFEVTL